MAILHWIPPRICISFIERSGITKIFYSMLLAAFVVEVPLSSNALLYTYPIMLIMIPLAIAIYSTITFIPKWIVENKVRKNKKKVILLVTIWIIVSILSYLTRVRG